MSNKLKELVKKIQFDKNWTVEQVASSIGYSRVHLTKQMQKGGKSNLEDLLIQKHQASLQNVARETTLDTSIKDLEEWRVMMDAALGVIISELVPLVAKATGKSNAGVAAQLKKDIQDETQNRLAELKRGQRS